MSKKDAIELSRITGEDKKNPYGVSCYEQGLETASILAEIGADSDTIAAAHLFGCVQYADLKLEDVEETLGARVKNLIVGAQHMESVHLTHGRLLQSTQHAASIDNLRKMLLAMVQDVRVVLIKLAERLSVLHRISHFEESERKRIANEAMVIYAPLASRLGVWHLKWQLEDYAFRYLEHEKYEALSQELKKRQFHNQDYVNENMQAIKEILEIEGIRHVNISGRAKHIYSIYRKMQRKNVGLDLIYDVVALRILVPTVEDCYAALGAVNSHMHPIKEEFDDYIANPKSNGYQSLHTAVRDDKGNYLEIQIRTDEMHRLADLGVAAHWLYKEGKKSKDASYEAKIAWLRQLMDWQKEIESDTHIFDDRVYVFTPKGEVIELPKGATVLDFAFHIHSDLGNHCRGAMINNKMQSLIYQLKTGDKVEVLTDKNHTPSRDWLVPQRGYLFTAKARAKVNHWFKTKDYDEQAMLGEQMFEKEYKRLGMKEKITAEVLNHFNYKTKPDLMAAIGRGDLRVKLILNYITEGTAQTKKPVKKKIMSKEIKSEVKSEIYIEGKGNMLTYLAKCCKPLLGDEIIGYLNLARGVSVHRINCPSLNASKRINANKIVKAEWRIK